MNQRNLLNDLFGLETAQKEERRSGIKFDFENPQRTQDIY